jgi:ribosomal RNA-processing protein 12
LKDLLSHHVDHKFLLTHEDKPFDDEHQESMEASTIKSICAVFENALSAHNGTPNEHILGVISVLFIKLGMYMFIPIFSSKIFCLLSAFFS